MEHFIKAIVDWLIAEFPILLLVVSGAYVFLLIFKEIKNVFFDKGDENESFGMKLKYLFCFWLKRKTKIMEPKHVQYSNEERENIVSNLLVHNFFQSINNMKLQIPSMEFGSFKKSEIFRNIIMIYVETIEKYATAVLKTYKLDELETATLNNIFLQEIEKASFEIYSKMRIRLGDVLYNKLIEDPIRGFKARNSIFREVFINGVNLISSQAISVYSYDNYERVSQILTSMHISLQLIVKNFEKVFKDYNGELDKYLN